MDQNGKQKVLLGMSGGVDSSAAAVILKKGGYDVTGCTLLLSENSSEGADEARAVCRKLGIQHITLDLRREFDKYVITPFAKSYMGGETPSPCIECNKYIKFGLMLKKSAELGFDFIATGHYASVVRGDNGRLLLSKPRDKKKDQTYMLYSLTEEQLSRTFFPLYNVIKPEVRKIAEENGLANSDRPDSQDICFAPDGDYAGFIEAHTGYKPRKGDFINLAGEKIGRHSGLIRYTVGQRRGLGAAFGKPVFVCGKDAEKNTVTLSDERDLYKRTLFLRDVNLIAIDMLSAPMEVTAKIRSSAKEQEAVISPGGNNLVRVDFKSPVRAPATGQSCVFYSGDIVVGGGVIQECL